MAPDSVGKFPVRCEVGRWTVVLRGLNPDVILAGRNQCMKEIHGYSIPESRYFLCVTEARPSVWGGGEVRAWCIKKIDSTLNWHGRAFSLTEPWAESAGAKRGGDARYERA